MASPSSAKGGGGSTTLRNTCLTVIAVVVIIIVILVILSVTVFRARRPVTTVDDVTLKDMNVALDAARLGVDINVTLDVNLSIKNPNKVSFKYKDSTAFLHYRGETVGEAVIPAGEIDAGETTPMKLTLTVMADRLLSKAQLYTDVLNGTLPFNARTRISGKVGVLGVFKLHVTSTSSCDFNVSISNRRVGDQNCSYKTKF